jgi:hypothetical protein
MLSVLVVVSRVPVASVEKITHRGGPEFAAEGVDCREHSALGALRASGAKSPL